MHDSAARTSKYSMECFGLAAPDDLLKDFLYWSLFGAAFGAFWTKNIIMNFWNLPIDLPVNQ
jgi:hypothetical protein